MYNHPHGYINSYPFNFRAINGCTYATGDSHSSSEVTVNLTGGRQLQPWDGVLGENIVTLQIPRPNLVMKGSCDIDIYATMRVANVLKIIIIDSLEQIKTIVTKQVSNSLTRSGDYDIKSHATVEITDVVIKKYASSNIDTDVGMYVEGALIKSGNTDIDEYVTVNVTADVVKLTAFVNMKSYVTFKVLDTEIIKPKLYRGGSRIEVNETVRFGSYVKQWALFVRPLTTVNVSSVHGKLMGSLMKDSLFTMVADSWIKQWSVIVGNTSDMKVQAIIGKNGYVKINPSITMFAHGSQIHNSELKVDIDTDITVDVSGMVTFNGCTPIRLIADRPCSSIAPSPEQSCQQLIRIDRSCFKNNI